MEQKLKCMEVCEGCGCDPCDCGWGNYINIKVKSENNISPIKKNNTRNGNAEAE
jgi:hypothetical protein